MIDDRLLAGRERSKETLMKKLLVQISIIKYKLSSLGRIPLLHIYRNLAITLLLFYVLIFNYYLPANTNKMKRMIFYFFFPQFLLIWLFLILRH